MKRAALYLRVSTGEQTTENQRRELLEVASRAGWEIVEIYEDAGISGAKGRDKRPAFDKLLKDATRRKFDLVAAWSVDRLGRSTKDLISFLSDIQSANVDLYLHKQALDTSTPAGKALFGMLAIFAEFERAMIQDRVKTGLARAKADGVTLGRPQTDPKIEDKIRETLKSGVGIIKAGKMHGVGTSVAQRIANELKKL